jgi:hypothetical protein
MAFIFPALAGHKIQDTGEGTVSLKPSDEFDDGFDDNGDEFDDNEDFDNNGDEFDDNNDDEFDDNGNDDEFDDNDDEFDDNGDVPRNAGGTAKFKIDKKADGTGRMTVTVDVENLPERAQRVYEVWLIDDGGEDVNLTAFNTDNDGNAKTTTTRGIVSLAPYDEIIVSEKRTESFSTTPGEEILSGRLHGSDDEFDDNGSDDEFNDDSDNGDSNHEDENR